MDSRPSGPVRPLWAGGETAGRGPFGSPPRRLFGRGAGSGACAEGVPRFLPVWFGVWDDDNQQSSVLIDELLVLFAFKARIFLIETVGT